jgi:hypothetical protein
VRIAHVVNPVAAPSSSDLSLAQPISFESMRLAQRFAAEPDQVEVFAACFPEDMAIVPSWCNILPPLDRSVLEFKQFKQPRKLPLIQDILYRLAEATDAEYLIYTNVDIALMPHFYNALVMLLKDDIDALSITRRTISKTYSKPSELALMYAEVGKDHPGHDCFVFRRDTYKQFDLGKTCIGARLFARIVLLNILVHATKFKLYHDLHMTFHLGDDRAWKTDSFADYTEFQRNEMRALLHKYHQAGKLKKHPLIKKWVDRNTPELRASQR